MVLLKSDKTPVAVLKPPLVSLDRARRPVAVFWLPPVRWLSASKPVPVFQIPEVRLISTPIPSPLLEPGMVPSVSGPTACVIGARPRQMSTSRTRSAGIGVLKILAYQSRQKFAEMTRLRAATPKLFAHRGRHGDQDGQTEQAARQAND